MSDVFGKPYYCEELADVERDISEYLYRLGECDGVYISITPITVGQILASYNDVIEVFDNKPEVDIHDIDEVLTGLLIISRYFDTDKTIVSGAVDSILYSVGIDELIDAKLTMDDLNKLSKLNWMAVDGKFAVFT